MGREIKVGDFAWNLRDSSLDLRPGDLVLVYEIVPGPHPYKGRIQLFNGNYNGVGYYFGPNDLKLIELGTEAAHGKQSQAPAPQAAVPDAESRVSEPR
jgi:hypothetical protein